MKIIDSFLFFQELDLLEIRLRYLNDYVDFFVIVEACQTFTGKKKEYVFEKNKERFTAYSHKIKYYKIQDFHDSYESIMKHLSSSYDPSYQKISNLLEKHNHYPKSKIHWVLDTYHREYLHFALDKEADDDDIVLLSDLDEIPSIATFDENIIDKFNRELIVFQQAEFKYFLNFYNDSEWLGTIASRYSLMKGYSFCSLRIDSKKNRNIISKDTLKNGGFHFTSCGNVDMIKNKIQSWAHQEFNNNLVMKNLEKNIMSGNDIFLRKTNHQLEKLDISKSQIFDDSIRQIMKDFPHLVFSSKIQSVDDSLLSKMYNKFAIIIYKIKQKL